MGGTTLRRTEGRRWAPRARQRREVAWVRLGVFLFEQLPKNLLNGLTPCRWRPHAEAGAHLFYLGT